MWLRPQKTNVLSFENTNYFLSELQIQVLSAWCDDKLAPCLHWWNQEMTRFHPSSLRVVKSGISPRPIFLHVIKICACQWLQFICWSRLSNPYFLLYFRLFDQLANNKWYKIHFSTNMKSHFMLIWQGICSSSIDFFKDYFFKFFCKIPGLLFYSPNILFSFTSDPRLPPPQKKIRANFGYQM